MNERFSSQMFTLSNDKTIIERCNSDERLVRLGRYCNIRFCLGIGEQTFLIHVEQGLITRVDPSKRTLDTADFAILAPEESWRRFSSSDPPPGFNDILAMIDTGNATFEGDALKFFSNLMFLKGIFSRLMQAGTIS